MPNFQKDKEAAAQWAKDLLEDGNFVVLDTETTSLKDAAIVQIAIVDSAGETLLYSLVKPDREIEAKAQEIHGIYILTCLNSVVIVLMAYRLGLLWIEYKEG